MGRCKKCDIFLVVGFLKDQRFPDPSKDVVDPDALTTVDVRKGQTTRTADKARLIAALRGLIATLEA